jgi:hypothetical protein
VLLEQAHLPLQLGHLLLEHALLAFHKVLPMHGVLLQHSQVGQLALLLLDEFLLLAQLLPFLLL